MYKFHQTKQSDVKPNHFYVYVYVYIIVYIHVHFKIVIIHIYVYFIALVNYYIILCYMYNLCIM